MFGALGSLYVELSANTAKFTGPLGDAARAAKSAANDISKEFSSLQRVASQTFGAFGEFNPIVSELSFALSKMGRAASDAMGSFGRISTAAGAVAAIGAGASAALASVAVGTLAMAARSTEAAAKMYELSQSTGVSVEALSGLSLVAKQNGVSTEAMVTGLERMSKSAFAAASAPVGAINAYTRLGVSLKDSANNMRPTEEIFEDIATRFAAMGDGGQKTALAIQIFGRSGADLIPVLNQGSSGIKDLLDLFQKLGGILSGEVAEKAEKFQSTLGLLGVAASGASNQLLAELEPSLQAIADALLYTAENGHTTLENLTHYLAEFAKDSLGVLNTWMHGIAQVGIIVEALGHAVIGTFEAIIAAERAGGDLAIFDFSGAEAEVKAGTKALTGIFTDFWDESKKNWKDNADFINSLTFHPNFTIAGGFAAGEDFLKRSKRPGGIPLPTGTLGETGKDTVNDLVSKLSAQTSAELALAAATGLSAAALVAQKAAGEADAKIADTRTELLDRERSLKEQLGNAKANQQGPEQVRIEAEIAGVQKLRKELDRDVPVIKNLYLELGAAQEATRIGGELSKEGQGFSREIDSLQGLVAAYKSGSAAIASAGIDKELEEDKQRVAELLELFNRIEASDPFNSAALIALGGSLRNANAMLTQHRAELEEIHSLSVAADIAKETAAFNEQSNAVSKLNSAYLLSAGAVRAAEVDVKVAQYRTSNPGAPDSAIAAITELYRRQADQARATTTSEMAGEYELNRAYQDQLDKLNAIRAALIEAHQPTMLVDVAISQTGIDNTEKNRQAVFESQNEELLGDAKLYDQKRELNAELDQAAEKVGTLGERYRALLDQIQQQGANPLGAAFGSLEHSLDGLSDTLAKFIITGKNGFKQWADQLGEGLLKNSIQSSFGALAGLALGRHGQSDDEAAGIPDVGSALASGPKAPGGVLGGVESMLAKAFGIGKLSKGESGKSPTGSSTDPLFVKLSGSGSGPGAGEDPISKLLGSSHSGGSGTSSSSGLFSSLGSLFENGGVSESTPSGANPGNFLGLPVPEAGASSGLGSLGSIFSKLGSGIGSAAGAIGGGVAKFVSMFGGFLADGGDVTPGKTYMVGEKHPEFFTPKQAGTVSPTMKTSAGGGGAGGNTIHMHLHGVDDADSFRHSQPQIFAHMHAQLAMARSRNG